MIRKRTVALLFTLWMCCASVSSLCEVEPVKWKDAIDHNRWTELMLFKNPAYKSYKPSEIKTPVEQLEAALLLCIDQYNGSGKNDLEKIRSIRGIPQDISAIDFSAGPDHRAYTHRGWNHTYANFENEKSHPNIRKQILISVVNSVFSFSKYFPPEQAEKICDSMSCLLYNIHIIEDRYHSKSYYGAANTLLLASDGSRTESVTHDLLECLPTLFPNQKKDTAYRKLVTGIQRIANNIVSETKQNNDNDSYLLIDRKYAVELRDLLSTHLLGLLQKQAWFCKVFDPKWNSD